MRTPIAINGFGRIGRQVFRILSDKRDQFQVVAINDLGDAETLLHLLKYDSTHGRFDKEIRLEDGAFVMGDDRIPILSERDPAALPWGDMGNPIVLESTGVFRMRAQLEQHLAAGASKVLLTVPPKDEIDALVVLGVNDDDLKAEHKIVSNASCTTNCLAPMAKVLHEAFGIDHGLMNTIHAYTNGQSILDLAHKDLRRARTAAQNIIPTTTGAARAVGKVLPALDGKLDGFAMRVPVADGSIVDLTVILDREVTKEEVNEAMKAAAEGPMKGIIKYSTDPIVSSDIIGDPHSNVFDAPLTMATGRTVKVLGWYDNEWGYSARCVDLLERMSAPVPATA
ncbi:MAG: type I glyceraldehyde-3-phosphate dehydrogenase [Planctomycetota bacterium]|nr:type I glyceraldehyde-3-phosphate dehydrogenase [Planctomycetota bacterium]